MSAASDVLGELRHGEVVEAIVFGEYGWGNGEGELGYGEPDPPPVPFEQRGKLLTWEEAEPFMRDWQFSGGFGAPECYAVNIWTNQRVFFVHEYDGSTGLVSVERNPTLDPPRMT